MDLNYAHRAGPKNQNINTNVSGNRKLLRSLMVAFTCRASSANVREELLKHAKARKNLKSKDILNHGPENLIYVNERLTGEIRPLFRTVRAVTVKHGYSECWLNEFEKVTILQGFTLFYSKKYINREGGVGIYIKERWTVNFSELNVDEGNSILAEVANHFSVVAAYRSPGYTNPEIFIRSLDANLKTIIVDIELIRSELEGTDWSPVINCSSFDEPVTHFTKTVSDNMEIFENVYNKPLQNHLTPLDDSWCNQML
ncbi:unnamed protein product [Parnassius apollo]|uniref:(apollo) hypothetical protein n=1 Tax=Parnassius apollo TaxID=110799 RepID=A0A8S3WQ72_PARAO|nr:unnamed protein product [Parnassius apollo]